jgi:hypothetical protein
MRNEQEIMLLNKYKGMLSCHVIQTETYRIIIIFPTTNCSLFCTQKCDRPQHEKDETSGLHYRIPRVNNYKINALFFNKQ